MSLFARRFTAVGILLGVLLMLAGSARIAHANPTIFASATTTKSAASTSAAFMTPGTATSTLVYDAHAQTLGGGTYKTDFIGLLVQFSASNTSATLNLSVEYSQDGIDWYRNFVADPTQFGTTTPAAQIATPFTTTWKFASSTLGGATSSDAVRSTAAMIIPSPFRYTRLVSTMTGANGAVWAQFVPFKESR